jgi:tetratricopeptide (TPR) repeat protein
VSVSATRTAQPLVSVVVRSCARATLAETLESIAAQDYPHLETVVVAAAGPGHPRLPSRVGIHPLRMVEPGVPLTRPRAAQAGVDGSRGEAITFLDDDDVFLPGHVEGLVAMRAAAPKARVVYALAQARFRDGRVEPWGQPFALAQLYERSFVHLSSALFDRALVDAGCRFDAAFEIMEDWDFFLQCAQHTRFHFEPRCTFEWRADLGSSGAGGASNSDDARFARFRDRIYAKWQGPRDALFGFVQARLNEALGHAAAGDAPRALDACGAALERSPNDPWALNVVALIHRKAGRVTEARAAQETAVAVRPQDASLVYNLALLCRDAGDVAAARLHCARALALNPRDARVAALAASLDAPAVRHTPSRTSSETSWPSPTPSTPNPAESPPSSTPAPPE